MTHVVTEACIQCRYTDCVDVCPVDCFRQGPNFLAIDPDECIDCAVCIPECPVNAIVLTEVYEYGSYDRPSLYFTMEQLMANWDRFAAQLDRPVEEYVNPFWRPRGLPEHDLPAPKRLPVSPEWSGEQQVVGRKWRQHHAPEQS